METASFDLNESIAAWRRRMQEASVSRVEILDELEAHLRDSVSSMESKGLSAEEAFLVASRRIGDHEPLAAELTKVHPGEWITSRLAWMLFGMLGMNCFWDIWSIGSTLWILIGNQWGIGGSRLGWFATLANSLILISAVAGLAWRIKTHGVPGLSSWNLSASYRSKVLLAFVGVALAGKAFSTVIPIFVYRTVHPSDLGEAYGILRWESLTRITLVWLVAILVLVRITRKLGSQNPKHLSN
jgi:hypothetical protein